MILDSVVLENFGAYGGRQEVELTPKNGKPIILLGGMNGGGKTTLLDAVQLAFYGPKARISNRGQLAYKAYLKEAIHRGSDSSEGASITVRFQRIMEGETRHFELQRYWREGIKGIEETVRVLCDGLPDDVFTEHWDEAIEAYLPNGIAHLFFFDGEQIKDLAEGGHAADILGTAISSLLGLDLVDRLDTDLRLFERRKRAEKLDPEAALKLKQARLELDEIDREQEKAAMAEGALVNEAGRLAKELRTQEDLFRAEGGKVYSRRAELADELNNLRSQKTTVENQLRELLAGPLPLLLVEGLLADAEKIARHETEVRRSRLLIEAMEKRDADVISSLKTQKVSMQSIRAVNDILAKDRSSRINMSEEQLVLDADDHLAPHLAHLRSTVLPSVSRQADSFVAKIDNVDEKIARLEAELALVPSGERIAELENGVALARKAYQHKLSELDAFRFRRQALERQRMAAEAKVDRLDGFDLDMKFAEDDRHRMLKHSQKVRETLKNFRVRIVRRHTANIEALMLESFHKLLRNKRLVSGLSINPETFEVTLTGRDGKPLSFERLSAGEKQLFATSLLWGLARASGRLMPTIIDTPLGRLDSSHRQHLIKRYFPSVSHQVLLLSTDEEIVGTYYKALKPFISNSYLLDHDESTGQTNIKKGYFET